MKPNMDDRTDNAEKIKENIEVTKRNIELADELIADASNRNAKRSLRDSD